jgi:hypothetical protein
MPGPGLAESAARRSMAVCKAALKKHGFGKHLIQQAIASGQLLLASNMNK